MAFLNRLFSLVVMLLSLWGGAVAHADVRLVEQKIKAGLLYNFIKHTTWPIPTEAAPPPMTVCVYGDDDFETYLRPMNGRTVNQRKLRLQRVETVPESSLCHVLFVSGEKKGDWKELHRFLHGRQVLTVSDFAGFARNGGMIEFHKADQRIGAVFNLDAFARAGLEISGTLLGLKGVETLSATGEAP